MQVDSSANPSLSLIQVCFGDTPSQSAPITINASVDFLSSKVQNKRFNAAEFLNIEIPKYSILLELEAKGDAEDLAQKFNEIKKKSQSIDQLEKQKDVKITIVGKGNKVYILIISEDIEELIKKLQASVQGQQVSSEGQRWIELKIRSNNPLSRLQKLLEQKGNPIALIDSLLVIAKFVKTPHTMWLIKELLGQAIGQNLALPLSESFEYFNVDLQLESTSVLDNYSGILKSMKKIKVNHDFTEIRQQTGNKLEVFIFGKTISSTAVVHSEELYLLLDLLFA